MSIAWMDPTKIKFITIHCAATPEGSHRSAEQIKQIGMKRFGQPSYHYVIELDGSVHKLLEANQRGAHVGQNNTHNIGICYVGGMSADMKQAKDTRTEAQKRSMVHLLRNLLQAFPKAKVRGHRDWSKDLDGDGKIEPHEWMKQCPSFDVKSFLEEECLGDFFG